MWPNPHKAFFWGVDETNCYANQNKPDFYWKNNEPHGLTEAFLEPSRTSAMEPFIENSYGFLAVNYFRKKATLQMRSWVRLTSLIIAWYLSNVLYDVCNN